MTEQTAVIYGCEGARLNANEKALFADVNPYGFILFARNCTSPDQVKALVNDMREAVGGERPVLIDQEGGRVARLKPPHWRASPPAAQLAELAKHDIEVAKRAVYVNARLIAAELIALGVNVDCAPLLDVPTENSHDIIGDRAYGAEPQQVIELGRAMAEGLMDGGVYPVIKHIPGHGRALVDSHEDLPMVDAALGDLKSIDFEPFHALNDMPYGMTAHICYSALDAKKVATLSPALITLIRKEIGFDGLLMTDDLSMKALREPMHARVCESLDAGCDLVLHCNGNLNEMKDIATHIRPLTSEAKRRVANLPRLTAAQCDSTAFENELQELLPKVKAA